MKSAVAHLPNITMCARPSSSASAEIGSCRIWRPETLTIFELTWLGNWGPSHWQIECNEFGRFSSLDSMQVLWTNPFGSDSRSRSQVAEACEWQGGPPRRRPGALQQGE